MNTVTLLLKTPSPCYASYEGARAAARRMFRKGDNMVRVNGAKRSWTMDNIAVKAGGGFWGTGWVCWVNLPADGQELAQAKERPAPCTPAEAARIAFECRTRTAEILASHGFEPF